MHGTYTLGDGREIHLRELRQWWTYEGVLEGRPSPDDNGHQLAALVRRHQYEGRGASLYLGGIETGERSEAFPFGRPARLPPISNTARFLSYSPVKGSDAMCSKLTLIWFQTDFGLQSDFDAAMAALDWEAQAADYDV